MCRLLVLTLLVLIPGSVSAAVFFSEIAWMGTDASANDEWIELYNDGPESVDLDGWQIVTEDESLDFILTGNISAGGFYILERTDDFSLPDMPADYIYVGSLGNSGEILYLKNDSGVVIDQVVNSDGWQAGDSSTKETMQKDGSGWVTGVATPGKISLSAGTGDEVSETKSVPPSQYVAPVEPRRYELSFSVEGDLRPGNKLVFDPLVAYGGDQKVMGRLVWNFGDGTGYQSDSVQGVVHQYHHPGNYTVRVQYFKNRFANKPTVEISRLLAIKDQDISLEVASGIGLVIKNNGEEKANISNWKVQSETRFYVLPPNTVVEAGGQIMLPVEVTGFDNPADLSLWGHGKEMATFLKPSVNKKKVVQVSNPATLGSSTNKINKPAAAPKVSESLPIHKTKAPALVGAATAESKGIHWSWLALIGLLLVGSAGVVLLIKNHGNYYSDEVDIDDIRIIE